MDDIKQEGFQEMYDSGTAAPEFDKNPGQVLNPEGEPAPALPAAASEPFESEEKAGIENRNQPVGMPETATHQTDESESARGESASPDKGSGTTSGVRSSAAAVKAPGSRKNRKGLFILCILTGLCIISKLLASFESGTGFGENGLVYKPLSFVSAFSAHTPHLAVLHIEGTIEESNSTYDQAWLIDTIRTLAETPSCCGILLYIDSPGGGVYESDEVYLELLDYKEVTGNPVHAYLGPLAASGGYYIACAADYITANRNTLTGSIGVIAGQSIDVSKLLETYGIQVTTFTAGKNKDMLSMTRPVTPEQRDIMQAVADECYLQFTQIVSDSRCLPIDTVTELADGRIYTAQQALDNGLIDSIDRFDTAVDEMILLCTSFPVDVIHYYPEEETSLYQYIMQGIVSVQQALTAGSFSGITQLIASEVKKVLPEISYPAYYYIP